MSHQRQNKIQLPQWAYELKRGDILKKGSSYRIVREFNPIYLWGTQQVANSSMVTFSILHCSWTKACYTLLHLRDVVKIGYVPTGMRAKLSTEIDFKIDHDIKFGHIKDRKLTCCDVEGIF